MAPEIVPRNLAGTDSFAYANASTLAPDAKAVMPPITTKPVSESPGKKNATDQPIAAVSTPVR